MAWTSSPSHFWRFPYFARGQYRRTAPARKIRNLSHFLKVLHSYLFFYANGKATFALNKSPSIDKSSVAF